MYKPSPYSSSQKWDFFIYRYLIFYIPCGFPHKRHFPLDISFQHCNLELFNCKMLIIEMLDLKIYLLFIIAFYTYLQINYEIPLPNVRVAGSLTSLNSFETILCIPQSSRYIICLYIFMYVFKYWNTVEFRNSMWATCQSQTC